MDTSLQHMTRDSKYLSSGWSIHIYPSCITLLPWLHNKNKLQRIAVQKGIGYLFVSGVAPSVARSITNMMVCPQRVSNTLDYSLLVLNGLFDVTKKKYKKKKKTTTSQARRGLVPLAATPFFFFSPIAIAYVTNNFFFFAF